MSVLVSPHQSSRLRCGKRSIAFRSDRCDGERHYNAEQGSEHHFGDSETFLPVHLIVWGPPVPVGETGVASHRTLCGVNYGGGSLPSPTSGFDNTSLPKHIGVFLALADTFLSACVSFQLNIVSYSPWKPSRVYTACSFVVRADPLLPIFHRDTLICSGSAQKPLLSTLVLGDVSTGWNVPPPLRSDTRLSTLSVSMLVLSQPCFVFPCRCRSPWSPGDRGASPHQHPSRCNSQPYGRKFFRNRRPIMICPLS